MKKNITQSSELMESLHQFRKGVKKVQTWKQLEAIWLHEYLGLDGRQTADVLNYKLQTVYWLWHRWRREGMKMFEKRIGPGGRKHAYLTEEEERSLLHQVREQAKSGQHITVAEIRKVYEARVGRTVALSTIYRLLDRQDWWKTVPKRRRSKIVSEILDK